jgi:hypothetical protein
MKNLKMLFVVLVTVCFSNLSVAQEKTLTEEQKKERKQKMDESLAKLQLTEEQKPQYLAIRKKYAEKMQALKAAPGSRRDKFSQFQTISDDLNGEMKKILSEEQFNTFTQMMDEEKSKMMQNARNR